MKKHYIAFGYQMRNGEYTIDKKEAEAVKQIFDAYCMGDSLRQIAEHMTLCGPPYHRDDNCWTKSIVARILSNNVYCGTKEYPAIIKEEQYRQVQHIRNEKSAEYSTILQPFRRDMQCGCCGERLYWFPKTHQWYCQCCGMWANPIRPEELSLALSEKLYWIYRHSDKIKSPSMDNNVNSIEVARLNHEITSLIKEPEPDTNIIISKILHRAELQLDFCSTGVTDPRTMQIKRACKEFKPVDKFPQEFYTIIVSKVILYRDTHIEIKLRNGQIL